MVDPDSSSPRIDQARPAPPIRIQQVSQLGQHADRWDELVALQPLPSPFLRSWWVDHVAAGDSAIVLVLAGDELLGGAAFELDTIGVRGLGLERVRMLGQGVLAPDHLDVVATPGSHAAVARAVLGWLRRGRRIIDLDGLAAGGTLATLFAPYETGRTGAPWATLTDGVDTYFSARPGALRSTVKRSGKRFERDGATVRLVAPADAPEALDSLARLHDLRWATESKFLAAWQRFRTGAIAGAARGDVAIHELVDESGEVLATQLDLVVGTRVGFYQSGRRTEREFRGSGSVVRAAAIRHAASLGATEYDLLRGDEDYKADWATARREVISVRAPHGVVAAAALGAAALRRRVNP